MKGSALQRLFARRYLRSARSLSVVNTTATVSSVATGVAVAAMVILMSVYNGFDSLLQSLYSAADADLVISPAQGKFFPEESLPRELVGGVEGVGACSYYIEESVVAEYRGRQKFATLRGVDDHYTEVVGLAEPGMMLYGEWKLRHGSYRRAVVGCELDEIFADGYTARNASLHDLLTIHALRRENISPLLPMSAIRSEKVRHAGSLSAAANTLGGHIFTSLDWAQGLLAVEGRASAMAVDVVDGEREERVRDRVQAAVGEEFVVRTRYELNESVYKATRVEKWSIFFILLLVTIIAAATIVGSLVMLVTEKRNDIATLYSVGGNRAFVAGVFRQTGLLIGVRGVVGGLAGGLAVCLVQILFGPVKMPGTTFLVENYPVEIRVGDLAGIVVAVVAVTLILPNFTVSRMIPRGAKPDETRF